MNIVRTAMLLAVLLPATARAIEYHRPVEAAPTERDIGGGYVTPEVQRPPPRAAWWSAVDAAALAAALGASTYLALVARSRRGLLLLTIACLLYFGFYRKGCVCPIGAIQNVSLALADPRYTIPFVVIVFFFLPLVFSLLFGRVFCGGVCPLGAIQDVVLVRPVNVPRRIDKTLGRLRYVYLALAVVLAVPSGIRDTPEFIICRFDPFVGFFRRTGPGEMIIAGGAFLLVGLFIGRPYCRYLCPYGGLLAVLSRFSWKGVRITPDHELDCGLCTAACPFGAIEKMRAVRTACLSCGRCYVSCPRERVRRGEAPSQTPAEART